MKSRHSYVSFPLEYKCEAKLEVLTPSNHSVARPRYRALTIFTVIVVVRVGSADVVLFPCCVIVSNYIISSISATPYIIKGLMVLVPTSSPCYCRYQIEQQTLKTFEMSQVLCNYKRFVLVSVFSQRHFRTYIMERILGYNSTINNVHFWINSSSESLK